MTATIKPEPTETNSPTHKLTNSPTHKLIYMGKSVTSEKEFQKKLKRISMNGTLKSGTSPDLLGNSDVHLAFKDLLTS